MANLPYGGVCWRPLWSVRTTVKGLDEEYHRLDLDFFCEHPKKSQCFTWQSWWLCLHLLLVSEEQTKPCLQIILPISATYFSSQPFMITRVHHSPLPLSLFVRALTAHWVCVVSRNVPALLSSGYCSLGWEMRARGDRAKTRRNLLMIVGQYWIPHIFDLQVEL